MRLKDKVAIVTGADSAIGREIARSFVREGARVAIADLNQEGGGGNRGRNRRSAQGVRGRHGRDERVQVNQGVRHLSTVWHFDVLVSNAGIKLLRRWMNSSLRSGKSCRPFI